MYETREEQWAAEAAGRRAAAEAAIATGELPQDPDEPAPDLSTRAKLWGSELVAYAVNYGVPEPVYLPVLGQPGFIRRGYSHILAAAPKMGKTELLLQSLGDWQDEQVAYLSEEYPDLWLERLAASRKVFPDRYYEHVQFVFLARIPHSQRIHFIEDMLRSPSYSVVVVDTIRSGLVLEDENDNAALRRALEPLTAAAHENEKTLVLIHHTNKAQATTGSTTSIAGGFDMQGAMDAVLVLAPLYRKQNTDEDTRRVLRGWGRMRCGGTLQYQWPEKEGPMVIIEPEEEALTIPPSITYDGVTTDKAGLPVATLRSLAIEGRLLLSDKKTGELLSPLEKYPGKTLLWSRPPYDPDEDD